MGALERLFLRLEGVGDVVCQVLQVVAGHRVVGCGDGAADPGADAHEGSAGFGGDVGLHGVFAL